MSDKDRLDIEAKMMAALLSNSALIKDSRMPEGEELNPIARVAVEAAATLRRESQAQND